MHEIFALSKPKSKMRWEKYGGVPVLAGVILYNLGFIFQLIAVPSSDWVSSDLTKLPLEIPMPAGGQGSQLDLTCRLAQCPNHDYFTLI